MQIPRLTASEVGGQTCEYKLNLMPPVYLVVNANLCGTEKTDPEFCIQGMLHFTNGPDNL